jgi:hypothetical protein
LLLNTCGLNANLRFRPLLQHPHPLPDGQPDPRPVLHRRGKDTEANWLSRRDARLWAFWQGVRQIKLKAGILQAGN